jgi:hypothetical protein
MTITVDIGPYLDSLAHNAFNGVAPIIDFRIHVLDAVKTVTDGRLGRIVFHGSHEVY